MLSTQNTSTTILISTCSGLERLIIDKAIRDKQNFVLFTITWLKWKNITT